MGWYTGHGLKHHTGSQESLMPPGMAEPVEGIAQILHDAPEILPPMHPDALRRKGHMQPLATTPSYEQLLQYIEHPEAYRS